MTISSKHFFGLHKPNKNKIKNNKSAKREVKRHKGITKLLLITAFLTIIAPFIKVKAAWHPVASLTHAVVAGLVWVILIIPVSIGGALSKMASVFMSHTLDPKFFPVKFTQMYQGGVPTFVGTGWGISRDLAYMIIVIVLIAAGLGIALRIFEAQKILASIIIAAFVIPFTPLICGLVIDPANILTNTFLNSGAVTNITSYNQILKNFGDMLHNRIYNAGPSGAEESLGSDTAGRILNTSVYVLTVFMAAIAMFLYGVLFIVRGIALYLIVIFSPLAVVASIFPQTKKWFSQWFQQLVGWAFVAPIAVFFLYLTGEMIHTLYVSGGAQNLGLGSMAYFMIPPLTMYAGLAVISAAGPTGAKATIGIVKKQGGALVRKGIKWGGTKLATSKVGEWIYGKTSTAGGKIPSPNETLKENAPKIQKALAWTSYGIRKGLAKGIQLAGQNIGEIRYKNEENTKKQAEKEVGQFYDEAKGDIETFTQKVESAASYSPNKKHIFEAMHDKLKKKGKLGDLKEKDSLFFDKMQEFFVTQGDKKRAYSMMTFNISNPEETPDVVKNFAHKQMWSSETEKIRNEFISNNTNKVDKKYKDRVKTIISNQLKYSNLDKDTEFNEKEKRDLEKAGIKINDLVKSINKEKGDLKNVKDKIDKKDAIIKIGVKGIKAKDIEEEKFDKDTLSNEEVMKEFIRQGKVQEARAAARFVQGNYAQKLADIVNKAKPGEEGIPTANLNAFIREGRKPASPLFDLIRDQISRGQGKKIYIQSKEGVREIPIPPNKTD